MPGQNALLYEVGWLGDKKYFLNRFLKHSLLFNHGNGNIFSVGEKQ